MATAIGPQLTRRIVPGTAPDMPVTSLHRLPLHGFGASRQLCARLISECRCGKR